VALNKLNHIYGEPLVVSSLNTTGDTVVDGALTVLGTSNFVGAVTFGSVTNAELQYLDGLTGNIQTQLDTKITSAQVAGAYAALSGAAFTGAISATGLTLTNDLTIANGGTGLSATTKGGIFVGDSTTSFTNLTVGLDGYLLTADSAQATGVKWAAAPVSLPTQTSNSGKFLTTDGTTASWATLGSSIPSQTGNNGKFLTTDGTSSSWATLTASNLTGGTLSSTILGNSNVFIGTTSVALNRTTANLGLTGISSVAFPGSTSGTTTVQASAAAGTTTFTLPATTGTACLLGNTFFVGTTSIANNRASASQTLTGTSIDGNAATASAVAASALTGSTLNSGVTASSLTSVGTITSGTWSGSFGAVSGANLTSLTAGNLSGTIPSGVLGNSAHFIGTTSIALNRASGAQTLTGVSIDGNAATATTTTGNAATATSAGSATYATYLNGASSSTGTNLTSRVNSGFWEQSSTSTANGWPVTSSWYHLIASTHSNNANYYSMQIAGSFFDNSNFYIRSTNNSGTTAWLSLITSIGGQTIAGNLTLSGTLTINSDARLKENLTPLTGALDKVKALTGYNYNRIGSETLEMGVVAQEVQKVAPELVLEDKEGTLSVAYQNMVALLIEAVKEQSAEIAALKEQVEELKG
jgi:hypothetical protein